MKRPSFVVDFNELLAPNLVLLSQGDERLDSEGQTIRLTEGLSIRIWAEDFNEAGQRDDLIAVGTVVPNADNGWAKHVKWCCLIEPPGIQHESDLAE